MTGSRAVWAILTGFDWRSAEVERVLLRSFWRGLLFTHLARNRPWPPPAPPLVRTSSTASLGRPWAEIARIARASDDSHFVKVLMNYSDFWDKWRDDVYWQAAEGVVAKREGGGRFVGTGAGSQIGRYVKASQL